MIIETIRIAVESLFSNKLRTFLSMLGIIIGVAAVIAIVSIGSMAQQEVTGEISSLGSNIIQISPGFHSDDNVRKNFTEDIVSNIDEFNPDVTNVVPDISSRGELIYEDESLETTVVGTAPGYTEIHLYQPREGRFLIDDDLENNERAAVVGSEIAAELFNNENPVGESLKVRMNDRSIRFNIVGLMAEKGRGMTGNLDDQIYVPAPTFMNKLAARDYLDGYYAQAVSSERAGSAVDQMEYFFTNYLGDEDDYRLFSQDQILDTMEEVTSTMSLMLGGIAAISLLVGGIGIMNIMLVSVTERTREIGIRKALGAKRRNIMAQFLFESLVLSGSGGIIGIGFGWLGAFAVSNFGGWPVMVSPVAVALAFSFSLAVGLFFGIYPAVKAAKLDPVDALSYE